VTVNTNLHTTSSGFCIHCIRSELNLCSRVKTQVSLWLSIKSQKCLKFYTDTLCKERNSQMGSGMNCSNTANLISRTVVPNIQRKHIVTELPVGQFGVQFSEGIRHNSLF
jgi:hypothetical protein